MNKIYKTPLGVTSQFSFCGLPLRLDTYAGCALSCTYCFARLRGGNANTTKIRIADDKTIIKKFSNAIKQKEISSGIVAELIRNRTPLHFGGMSDPFQPIEKKEGASFRVLHFLNSIKYPVVISTKSTLLSDQRYLDLIKQNPNIVVQFSFSTIDDKKSMIVEPHSFAPTEILNTIETLSKNNIKTTVRWQPYIPLLSDSPQVFIDRIAGVGVKHLGLEHLKLPVERNSPLWLKLSLKLDFDIKEYYIKHNSFKDGRELILPPDYKLRNALIVRQELRKRNMTFGSADNDIQYLSDNNCCCSGVDQFEGFENWNKFQIAHAIKKSRGKSISFDLISDEWCPMGSIDKYLNSHSRIEKGRDHNSVKEYVLNRWENLNSAFNPTKFYGVEDSGKRDNNGFRIFTWNDKIKKHFMSIDKLLKNDRTHWQWYKSFFNITILRYLVTWFAIVPIISKMIESVEPSLKIKDVVEIQLVNNATLPFNLQILWLSSLLFVIALFLYQMFCPSFIKTYSNFADYLQHHHSPRWIVWESIKVINDKSEIEKLFARLNTKGYVTEYNGEFTVNEVKVEKNQTAAYFRYGQKVYRLALPLLKMGTENEIDKDETIVAEKEIFWEIFGRFSSSKRYLRLAIIILLIISGLLFLFTLCEHIWQGLEYFI